MLLWFTCKFRYFYFQGRLIYEQIQRDAAAGLFFRIQIVSNYYIFSFSGLDSRDQLISEFEAYEHIYY